MNEIDQLGSHPAAHLGLSGQLLQLLVVVHEQQSVTRAAAVLGLTQSAVSHGLDRLRAAVGDALFVRAGRGIVATTRCDALASSARVLLEEMRSFTTAAAFDPAALKTTLTIAANDLQRDLLLPTLLTRLRAQAPGLALRVIASGVPSAEMLREGRCGLVITPRPPDAPDVVQQRLFEDRYAVFFDPAHRAAPATRAEYLAADHVTVLYEPQRMLDIDEVLSARGVPRRFVATVSNFAGVAAFVQGSDRIATLPSLLHAHVLHELALAPVPLPTPPMPMYLVWHLRHQADPLHQWLRQQVLAVVAAVLPEQPRPLPQALPKPQPAAPAATADVPRRRNSRGLQPSRRLKKRQK